MERTYLRLIQLATRRGLIGRVLREISHSKPGAFQNTAQGAVREIAIVYRDNRPSPVFMTVNGMAPALAREHKAVGGKESDDLFGCCGLTHAVLRA